MDFDRYSPFAPYRGVMAAAAMRLGLAKIRQFKRNNPTYSCRLEWGVALPHVGHGCVPLFCRFSLARQECQRILLPRRDRRPGDRVESSFLRIVCR